MRGKVDLNRSGNNSTLSALAAAATAGDTAPGRATGGGGAGQYFRRFADAGSPFDAQAEDEAEEDVMETTVSIHGESGAATSLCSVAGVRLSRDFRF